MRVNIRFFRTLNVFMLRVRIRLSERPPSNISLSKFWLIHFLWNIAAHKFGPYQLCFGQQLNRASQLLNRTRRQNKRRKMLKLGHSIFMILCMIAKTFSEIHVMHLEYEGRQRYLLYNYMQNCRSQVSFYAFRNITAIRHKA